MTLTLLNIVEAAENIQSPKPMPNAVQELIKQLLSIEQIHVTEYLAHEYNEDVINQLRQRAALLEQALQYMTTEITVNK